MFDDIKRALLAQNHEMIIKGYNNDKTNNRSCFVALLS